MQMDQHHIREAHTRRLVQMTDEELDTFIAEDELEDWFEERTREELLSPLSEESLKAFRSR